MDLAVLERPFPNDIIRTRKGPHGDLTYVEGVHYVRRLNEAFGGEWSWRIISHEVHGTEVVVQGVLTAGGQEKSAFGGSSVTTNRQTGEVMALGDDLKAAATDALKKAASMFGLGMHLYIGASEPGSAARPTRTLRAVPPERPVNGASRDDGNSTDHNRLTGKQLKAIFAIAHEQGLGEAELKAACVEAYGVAPQYLTKADASAFITSLTGR